MRFVGGEYEATEAAQGRLRRVLQLAEERDGVTLEAAFGALDKVWIVFRTFMCYISTNTNSVELALFPRCVHHSRVLQYLAYQH